MDVSEFKPTYCVHSKEQLEILEERINKLLEYYRIEQSGQVLVNMRNESDNPPIHETCITPDPYSRIISVCDISQSKTGELILSNNQQVVLRIGDLTYRIVYDPLPK